MSCVCFKYKQWTGGTQIRLLLYDVCSVFLIGSIIFIGVTELLPLCGRLTWFWDGYVTFHFSVE